MEYPGSPRSGPGKAVPCAACKNEREVDPVFAGVQVSGRSARAPSCEVQQRWTTVGNLERGWQVRHIRDVFRPPEKLLFSLLIDREISKENILNISNRKKLLAWSVMIFIVLTLVPLYLLASKSFLWALSVVVFGIIAAELINRGRTLSQDAAVIERAVRLLAKNSDAISDIRGLGKPIVLYLRGFTSESTATRERRSLAHANSGIIAHIYHTDGAIKALVASLEEAGYSCIEAISMIELVDEQEISFPFQINAFASEDWFQHLGPYIEQADCIIFHVATMSPGLKLEVEHAVDLKKKTIFIMSSEEWNGHSIEFKGIGDILIYEPEIVISRNVFRENLADMIVRARLIREDGDQVVQINKEWLKTFVAAKLRR